MICKELIGAWFDEKFAMSVILYYPIETLDTFHKIITAAELCNSLAYICRILRIKKLNGCTCIWNVFY